MIHKPNARRDAAVCVSKTTRQDMLVSVGELEAALARATFDREDKWLQQVLKSLSRLHEALTRQSIELHSDDGLMAEIVHETPRLSARVDQLRDQHATVLAEIESLRDQFATEQQSQLHPNVTDMRSRVEKLIAKLRQFQTVETDLAYEATLVDIGVGD